MNPFEFVLAIIVIVMVAQTVQKIYAIRAEKRGHDDGAEVDDAHAKLDALEERIRVLERIITENRYDLRREIDKL
jgi:hypothetical protein